MTTEKIKDCIKEIVEMLSIKAYSEIARKQFLKALSAEDIAESIANYGGAVTMPPDLNDFWNFDFYFMADDKNILSIEYNLLIDDVRSDLTLVFYFKDGLADLYEYSIYGIYMQ